MKLFFVMFALTLLVSQAQATTSVGECMNKTGCYSNVTSDGGSGAAKTCKLNTSVFTCECQYQTCGGNPAGYYVSSSAACNSGYTNKGLTILGKACCHTNIPCPPPPQVAAEEQGKEEILTTDNGDVGTAFEPNVLGDIFWGVYNGSTRSPNNGRIKNSEAKLDICLGSTDVDTAKSMGNSWCQNTACGSSYNEYCNLNSAAVCKDRCECVILGENDSACGWL